MDINFEYSQVAASERLEDLCTKKLNKLYRMFGSIMVATDVYLKSENTTSRDTGMICKLRVNVKNGTLFAEASKGTFDESVAEAMNDLERQLRKTKEKLQSY